MKISIINGDGTTTYVENMTPVTSLEGFSDSLTSATQALNESDRDKRDFCRDKSYGTDRSDEHF